jgi:hypothetical protein
VHQKQYDKLLAWTNRGNIVLESLSRHFPEGTKKNAEKFVKVLSICAETQTEAPPTMTNEPTQNDLW